MATNITWDASLTRRERGELVGGRGGGGVRRGLTVWMTGLSGSGKSTVAAALERALLERGVHAYRLDGDNVRFGLNRNLGFSPEDRTENIRRTAEVARLFADSCAVAVASFISPYRADRDAARALHAAPLHPDDPDEASAAAAGGNLPFVEVYVDCPVDVCEQRDPKGLYKKARQGIIKDFTGISAPYEAPLQPEIHIKSADESTADSVRRILAYLEEKGYIAAKSA